MHTSLRLLHLLQDLGRSPSHYKWGDQVSNADLYCHRCDDVAKSSNGLFVVPFALLAYTRCKPSGRHFQEPCAACAIPLWRCFQQRLIHHGKARMWQAWLRW